MSFNPHPSRTTGATARRCTRARPEDVSILTRRERRVQPGTAPRSGAWPQSFNPHPSRTTGATDPGEVDPLGRVEFQSSPVRLVSILTRRERRVQHRHTRARQRSEPVSILTRRERRVQPAWGAECYHKQALVSILTRRERRVQRARRHRLHADRHSFNPHPSRTTGATPAGHAPRRSPGVVSILTRRERRVQLEKSTGTWSVAVMFQSSPVANDGCNFVMVAPHAIPTRFQSSPVANDGCNVWTARLTSSAWSSFNPHPSRTTGATTVAFMHSGPTRDVSILTRRERRVQP